MATAWKLTGDRATLSDAPVQVDLNLKHPNQGLQVPQFHGRSSNGLNVLQIALAPPRCCLGNPVDPPYIRGRDLVVRYAQEEGLANQIQADWRPVSCVEAAAGIQLMLSVQTSLLHSIPTVQISSEVPASEVLYYDVSSGRFERIPLGNGLNWHGESGSGLFLFRLSDGETSYAELVFPTDFQEAQLETGTGVARLSYQLFSGSLEKGVIRRSRVQAILMNRSQDTSRAITCFESFLASPPPLTA